eukprot:gene33591-56236_t
MRGRVRAASFADHYSQARQFWISQSEPEQAHLASALVFELSKVEHPHVREAMVAHLLVIDEGLAQRVADGLGLDKLPVPATPAQPVTTLLLNAGRAWTQTKRADGSRLNLETPAATAAIRGTDWDISVEDDGRTLITVLSGTVEFSNAQGAVSVGANEAAVAELAVPDMNKLRYVFDAVSSIRKALNGRVPLIGFSGSPWTLACYMVEGAGSDDYRHVKTLMYS